MPTCGNEIIFPKFLKLIVATRGSNCDKSTEWSIIAVAKGLTVALQDLSTNRKPLKSFSGSSVVSAILCVVSGDRSAVVSETLCPCSPILLTYATCDIGIVVSTPPTIIVMWSNASNSFTSPTIAVPFLNETFTCEFCAPTAREMDTISKNNTFLLGYMILSNCFCLQR